MNMLLRRRNDSEEVRQYFSRDPVTGIFTCRSCLNTYAKLTTVTRLRAHLTGEGKNGAKPCKPIHQSFNSLATPSNPPYAERGVAEAMAMSRLPPNGSDANSHLDNQRQLGFYSQQPPMPCQNTARVPPEVTSEGMNDLTEPVMPPNETTSNSHQIVSGANNHYIPSCIPEPNNNLGNQGGLQFSQQQQQQHVRQPHYAEDVLFRSEGQIDLSHLDNQRQLEFWSQKPSMPCQNMAHVPLAVTSEGMNGLTEPVMPPNETSSANNYFMTRNDWLQLLPELNNDFCNLDGLQFPPEQHLTQGENVARVLLGETPEGLIGLTEEAMPPNGTGSNPHQIESGADNHYIPSSPPELDNNYGDQGRLLQNVTSTHPNECGIDENFPTQLQHREDIQETGEYASLTEFPVGDAFRKNVKNIWCWLMNDQVLRVGIYGIGGVGKTTLMRHIQTLLKGQLPLKVFWVTVPQDFSIWKLQGLIAKEIGLNFSNEEDEVKRAEKLFESLERKGKCVLILDDLRNNIDVDNVGIPVRVNLCRLVLTTRLVEVCRQMNCNKENTIQVQHLSKIEAWILFTQELGSYRTEAEELEELAKAVCRECACLPLGIRVMARSVKGITPCSHHTWRNIQEEMEEVLCVLKFSYLHLKDSELQKCLSYCALFPKGEKIDRNDLIEYMIVEGIIVAEENRRAKLDKGHKMLVTLENACLLEGDARYVWMHCLIWDMMILELREGLKTLVEVGAQLKELPDVEKWTENLVKVSLISNDIEVISSSHTPRCPNLSSLLLCRNYGLKMIADSFFEQFQSLKILDLTSCHEIEKLPWSISVLVNLTALILHKCKSLTYVPALLKLEKLEKLDLGHCRKLKQMPEGVRLLLSLKYLDLSKTGIEEIESGIIPELSQLQVLKLCNKYGVSKFSIRGNEVGALGKLETLHCRFSDPDEFVQYIESRANSQQSLTDYSFFIKRKGSPSCWPSTSRKFVSVTGYSFVGILAVLPKDVETLNIYNCGGELVPRELLAALLNLQEIRVYQEENGEWGKFPFPYCSFRDLKRIHISNCDKLKRLFPPYSLPELQMISVEFCNGMEEIFSTDPEEEDQPNLTTQDRPNLTTLDLPKLTTLTLRYLPELRSIYRGEVICDSLQQIQVVDCPKLERIPLPLPQPSLQRIQVSPKKWWDSVQWGSVDDKKHLESLHKLRRPLQR